MNAVAMYDLLSVLLGTLPWAFLAWILGLGLELNRNRLSASARHVVLCGALISVLIFAAIWGDFWTSGESSTVNSESFAKGIFYFELPERILFLVLLVWGAGVILNFVKLAWSVLSIRRVVATLQHPLNEDAQIWKEIEGQLPTRRRVRLGQSGAIQLPSFLGLLRPCVALPEEGTTDWDTNQRRAVLWHERAHAERYDDVSLLLQKIITAVLWWNPFVHLTAQQLDRFREEAADEWALRRWRQPRAYAAALLSLASGECLIGRGLAWQRSESIVARRLIALQRFVQDAPRFFSATQTILITACFLAGALFLAVKLPGVHLVAPVRMAQTAEPLPQATKAVWQMEELPRAVAENGTRWVLLTGPELAPGRQAAILVKLTRDGRPVAAYPVSPRNNYIQTRIGIL